jgi:hypothetical protein
MRETSSSTAFALPKQIDELGHYSYFRADPSHTLL